MSMFEVTFLRPYWLIALGLLAVVAVRSWQVRPRLGTWGRVVETDMLNALMALNRVEQGQNRSQRMVPTLFGFLVVIALSGPAIESRSNVTMHNLDGVVFVVDLSKPTEPQQIWHELQTASMIAMSSLGARPISVIVFAGDAYLAHAFSTDHKHVMQTLALLEPGLVPEPGAQVERALEMSADLMRQANIIDGDVILFSQGPIVASQIERQIDALAAQGARVSIMSLRPVRPEISAKFLQSGGQKFDVDKPDALTKWLDEEARDKLRRDTYPLFFYKDLGPFFLALGLMPLFVLFRGVPR